MGQGMYGIAGTYPETKNDGIINAQKEVFDLLKNIPEGSLLTEILSQFSLKENTPVMITVEDVTALTAAQLNALRAGDIVTNSGLTGTHAYTVSFRSDSALCLTCCDSENVIFVNYEKVEGQWTYQASGTTPLTNE